MIIDFKEIPQGNIADGFQDSFELFARDFLQTIGYKIVQHPDRGADGKKDLIVLEVRQGISGDSSIKWLVSCKHKAHSGKSVSDTDEPNISDRVKIHGCQGFIGFYSTLPSSSLGNNFEGLKKLFEIQSFDREQIEKIILESTHGIKLASRYFPVSYAKYQSENPKPAKIFSEDSTIVCEYCNKNLLEEKQGVFVLLRSYSETESGHIDFSPNIKAYFSCKGRCDRILKNKYLQQENLLDSWVDISDYLHPVGFIKRIMEWLNSLQKKEQIQGEAYDKLKSLILNSFPHVSREPTSKEKEHVRDYLQQGFDTFI